MDPNQQRMSAYPNPHQSYYQPVVPQPYPGPTPMTIPTAPRLVPFSKPWHVAKIVLRSLSCTLCIIIIGISAYLSDLTNRYSYYTGAAYAIFLASIPVPILAFIWDCAEFITICARGGKLGIHPGAHVGLHLIIWLGLVSALSVDAIMLASDDCLYSYSSFSCSSRSRGIFNERRPSEVAVTVFVALLLIIQFTLFVRACVETHQRNRVAPPIVMYQQQPHGAYMMPMPMPAPMQMPMQMQQPYPPPASYHPQTHVSPQPHMSMVSAQSSTPPVVDRSAMPAGHEMVQPQELSVQHTGTSNGHHAVHTPTDGAPSHAFHTTTHARRDSVS